MLIIPAIDLIDGKTVRLTEGDYGRRTDYGIDPVDVARGFEDAGAEWLHVVDLDGAKEGSPVNLGVLERIATATSLRIEFGGGLRDRSTIDAALSAGAERFVLGSILAKDPDFARDVFAAYGEKAIAGIDTRDGRVAVHGWLDTGEMLGTDLAREMVAAGCCRIITTDIARDGRLIGPNLEGLLQMANAVDVPVIASGGVAMLADLEALAQMPHPGVEGVIVGKALYEGRFTLAEALAVIS